MTTLALEFSTWTRSAAVRASDGRAGSAVWGDGRATPAFSLIDEALRAAGAARDEVRRLVIGLGPGSYTGIRAALAVAQGWRLATGVEVVGVSSSAAIAWEARQDGRRGAARVVVDAQRGEFYVADFRLTEACLEDVAPLRLVPAYAMMQGTPADTWFLGPGLSTEIPNLPGWPTATALLALADDPARVVRAEPLEPIYLRAPTFVKAPPAALRWAAEASRAMASAPGESA
ncbi:MAG: tRNA (adenosine(37)-N6)-threonylcarbamoyltransferase complex dimerization subunit type 1 TsaB [Limisphaerales bacterium]